VPLPFVIKLCFFTVLSVELWFVTDLYDDDADNGGIVCVHCRVDRSEDLFHGNKAKGMPNPDPSAEYQASFCLCNRTHESYRANKVNTSLVCDRRAVSDTTADSSEPQRTVRVGVPKPREKKRRRQKRQTPSHGPSTSTSSERTYQTDYK